MTMASVVGWMGTASGVVLLSIPVVALRRIAASGDVGALTCSYYLVQLVNCMAWVVYATLVDAPAVAVSNAWGILVAVYCAVLYLRTLWKAEFEGRRNPLVSYRGSLVRVFITAAIASFFSLALLCAVSVYDRADVARAVGTLSGCTGVLMLASPLERLRHILATKSAAVLSAPVTYWGIINRGVWVTYAALTHDMFILVPNSVGLLVGCLSALLLCLYNGRPSKEKTSAQMV